MIHPNEVFESVEDAIDVLGADMVLNLAVSTLWRKFLLDQIADDQDELKRMSFDDRYAWRQGISMEFKKYIQELRDGAK